MACFCLLSRELEVPQVRIWKNQQQFTQSGYRQFGDCISSTGEFVEDMEYHQENSFHRDRHLDGSSLSSKKGVCTPFSGWGPKVLPAVAL